MKHDIYIGEDAGDSREMYQLADDSIHLILTSPPYFNAKEYSQWESFENYLKDVRETLEESFRVLKPGRRFCLNVSDIPDKGESGVKWIPIGSELLQLAREIGFELSDRIFWKKTPMKGFQFGSLPYPPSPLITDSMEYVWVLRKPGESDYSHVSEREKERSKMESDEYQEYTKQVWTIQRVRKKYNVDGHIAPFPEEIPRRCIKLYSFVGETILDPYGGRGTTMKVAQELERNSKMYEIKEEYRDLIEDFLDVKQQKLVENNIEFHE